MYLIETDELQKLIDIETKNWGSGEQFFGRNLYGDKNQEARRGGVFENPQFREKKT